MDALRISGGENGVYLDYRTTFSCAADWKQGEGIFVPWSTKLLSHGAHASRVH